MTAVPASISFSLLYFSSEELPVGTSSCTFFGGAFVLTLPYHTTFLLLSSILRLGPGDNFACCCVDSTFGAPTPTPRVERQRGLAWSFSSASFLSFTLLDFLDGDSGPLSILILVPAVVALSLLVAG